MVAFALATTKKLWAECRAGDVTASGARCGWQVGEQAMQWHAIWPLVQLACLAVEEKCFVAS